MRKTERKRCETMTESGFWIFMSLILLLVIIVAVIAVVAAVSGATAAIVDDESSEGE